MDTKILKTSAEWIKDTNVFIYDPDGWDRKNFQFSFYEELISEEEFNNRLIRSTVMIKVTK
jgi:hypothetical protein